MLIHVVQQGDTLWELSQKHDVPLGDILNANGLTSSSALVVGQAVIIPSAAASHVVRSGETLWSISQKYGVTMQELARVNQINNPALIYTGQTLYIPEPSRPVIEVNAYTEKFGPQGAELVQDTAPYLTYISPFSYRVQSNGSLIPLDDAAIIQAAYDNHVAPMMVITNFENGTFSSEIAHQIFTDSAAQQNLLTNILRTMQNKGYTAINVDFEYVLPNDRELYNAFLRQLVSQLHPHGFKVSTALAPKLSATQIGTLYEAHDYEAHGRIVDFVIIMTYEWGWSGGPPRAVAPLNEVVKVLNYALTVIPANKVVMGMPLYGYNWTLPYVQGGKWAPTISPHKAVELAARVGAEIRYDLESESPYFNYFDEQGQEHVVWFEDARSVQAKFNIVKSYGLRGVSYWVLGLEFPQNWYTLQANFTVKKLV